MTTGLPSPELAFSDTASQPDEQIVAYPRTSAAVQPSTGPKMDPGTMDQTASAEVGGSEKIEKTGNDVRSKIFNLLRENEQERAAVVEKRGPLRLLDLPMDVLKEIVKEVTHTNDLTALALTHSALHNLAIPHIYSRFDIVWPDAHATTDPRTGVDALTYGLATLCMGDVSAQSTQLQKFDCTNCGHINTTECSHSLKSIHRSGERRLGNQYPQFTRKFSLGNGPVDWVQEYLITKESGKMLGTLVALAVARMINLETFVWDMPTGVLRDVWLALSSLQSRSSQHECRLERVWVRWHDNWDTSNTSPGQATNAPSQTPALSSSTITSIGWLPPPGSSSSSQSQLRPHSYAQSRVEFPTLSVLPPLKSLSVLDIDELDYLDEMSILIANSKEKLRELRVGIATKARERDFALPWDSPDLHQVDHGAQWPGASVIGERRLGGVLGVLVGRLYDIRKKPKAKPLVKKIPTHEESTTLPSSVPIPSEGHPTQPSQVTSLGIGQEVHSNGTDVPVSGGAEQTDGAHEHIEIDGTEKLATSPPDAMSGLNSVHDVSNAPSINHLGVQSATSIPHVKTPHLSSTQLDADSLSTPNSGQQNTANMTNQSGQALHPAMTDLPIRRSLSHGRKKSPPKDVRPTCRERLDGKLRLQTLELEHVSLSVAVLHKAFDWSVLTNLTILDCPQHDRLWHMLRRHFQPTTLGPSHSSSKHNPALQYHLNLRKIHTDAASTALIAFLKETLAPNTLETLFLQDRARRAANAGVTIDAIYRGPLKRHRSSLKKLMLDSSDKIPRPPSNSSDNTRWRAWMPNREVLNFITSGRMSSLRELSVAIDYKDWHHFLQRLPQIPHVRSLNIPFIADHVTPSFDPRELALQIVDVIVLRPEVELCYMGISHKCFEILENRPYDESHGSGDAHSTATGGGAGAGTDDEDDEEDEDASDEEEGEEEEEEEEAEEDDEEEDDNGTAIAPVDPDETESDLSDHDDSDADSYDGSEEDGSSRIRLRLREILFYDDKVAIFKARHGKL